MLTVFVMDVGIFDIKIHPRVLTVFVMGVGDFDVIRRLLGSLNRFISALMGQGQSAPA